MNIKEKFWNEKYRPQTIAECILPNSVKKTFEDYLIAGNCTNLMLHSTSGGTGKTTILKALANELDYELLFINASEQRSIDILRNDVTQFVSTLSIDGRNKAVLFDEFCNSQAITQNALRGFIEQYSKVKFFFSCNYIDKIIPQLLSRCTVIPFNWKADDKNLKTNFFKRIKYILETEQVPFNKDVVVELINRYFPDFRRIVNELQTYSITGSIDEGLLNYTKELDLADLFESIKKKNFTDVRQWVEVNDSMSYELFYKNFYKELKLLAADSCLPNMILLIGQYQFRHNSVMDKQINTLAFLIEVMAEIKFK